MSEIPTNRKPFHRSIVFGAKSPTLVTKFPDAQGALWSAHIKAVRAGDFCVVYEDVLFVETNETAYLLGIEEGDGRPRSLRDDLASKQQAFISFLREQTLHDVNWLGVLADMFVGQVFSSEVLATAAYLVAREIPMHIGIGYWTECGTYERFAIPKSERCFEMARMTLPFDELGTTSNGQ